MAKCLHVVHGQVGSFLKFLPCNNISLTLVPNGLTDISRTNCGSLCLVSETCEAFVYNGTSCYIEDIGLVNETLVKEEDGCYATKGKKALNAAICRHQ